jgi:hypothetical protein
VAVEQELVPVVEAQERDHPRAQAAVLVETRSVTVARHRDLAHLVAEDLAAVAETMREPAAIEVAVAWGAAE